MSSVTTHVLDAASGRPAKGIGVRLESGGTVLGEARTDDDGRVRALGPDRLDPGVYRLVFDTASHLGAEAFFPEVVVSFRVVDGAAHHHVPVLLSPFAYTTYRGS